MANCRRVRIIPADFWPEQQSLLLFANTAHAPTPRAGRYARRGFSVNRRTAGFWVSAWYFARSAARSA